MLLAWGAAERLQAPASTGSALGATAYLSDYMSFHRGRSASLKSLQQELLAISSGVQPKTPVGMHRYVGRSVLHA